MAFENKIEEINQRIYQETDNEIIGLLNKILITYTDLQRNQKRYGRHMDQMLKPLNKIESSINKRKEELSKKENEIIEVIEEKIIIKKVNKKRKISLVENKDKNDNKIVNSVNSVYVLCTYFGRRKNFPRNCEEVLMVLYDNLAHIIEFDFGIPCDVIIVNHDVTTFKDFNKVISKENRKLLINAKKFLDSYSDKKLLNGGNIRVIHRDWNDGIGHSLGSFNYAFKNFENRYVYWIFLPDDCKMNDPMFYKDLIDDLNVSEDVAFVPVWKLDQQPLKGAPNGISDVNYLKELCKYSGGNLPFPTQSKDYDLQVKMINQDMGLDLTQHYLNVNKNGEFKWLENWTAMGYRFVNKRNAKHLNTFHYRDIRHKHKLKKIIFSE